MEGLGYGRHRITLLPLWPSSIHRVAWPRALAFIFFGSFFFANVGIENTSAHVREGVKSLKSAVAAATKAQIEKLV